MTIEEFKTKLLSTKGDWLLMDGLVRCPDTSRLAGYSCPLGFVFNSIDLFAIDAAVRGGMKYSDAFEVTVAADGNMDMLMNHDESRINRILALRRWMVDHLVAGVEVS